MILLQEAFADPAALKHHLHQNHGELYTSQHSVPSRKPQTCTPGLEVRVRQLLCASTQEENRGKCGCQQGERGNRSRVFRYWYVDIDFLCVWLQS